MKRSYMVENIAEALLQTSLYGGDEKERNEVRKQTYMKRVILANAALNCIEKEGMHPPIILTELYSNLDNGWEKE